MEALLGAKPRDRGRAPGTIRMGGDGCLSLCSSTIIPKMEGMRRCCERTRTRKRWQGKSAKEKRADGFDNASALELEWC